MLLHEQITQLDHSIERENTSAVFEKLNKSQESYPNVEQVSSLENTEILEAIVGKELAEMKYLLLNGLLDQQVN